MQQLYRLKRNDHIPHGRELQLFEGISLAAAQAKGMDPIRQFSIFVEDDSGDIFGGATGTSLYGCLYIDMLWVKEPLRHKGWGRKLMEEAENIGRDRGCSFVAVNTMDWEALPFYQKLGYKIEFTRKGFDKDSSMHMLRKELTIF